MSNTPQWAIDEIIAAKENKLKILELDGVIFTSQAYPPLTTIPEEIFELSFLEELDLSLHQIAEIPEEITKLENLSKLNLNSNKLKNIPQALAKMKNLRSLNIGNNDFSCIPESISTIESLEKLSLTSFKIKEIPSFIFEMNNLTELHLDHNQLSKIPESITKLQNLTSLGLGENNFSIIPDFIGELRKLEIIFLFNLNIKEFPESIIRLKNLTTLWLMNNQLAEIPETIIELQNLTSLGLSQNSFKSFPLPILELKSLKKLWFDSDNENQNQIIEIPINILKLTNLELLSLKGNPIEIPSPEFIGGYDKILKKEGIKKIKDYFLLMDKENAEKILKNNESENDVEDEMIPESNVLQKIELKPIKSTFEASYANAQYLDMILDHYNNRYWSSIIDSCEKDISKFIESFPNPTLSGIKMEQLYLASQAYKAIGENEKYLACLKILFSLSSYSHALESTYSNYVDMGTQEYLSLANNLGIKYLNEIKIIGLFQQKSGCFIATAAYGSQLADQVILLKKFRDDYLKNTPIGTRFISCYYKFSPHLAKIIRNHDSAKIITKVLLYPLVKVIGKLLKKDESNLKVF